MMTNLFSIFDPATTNNQAMNWVSCMVFMFFLPSLMWVVPSQTKQTMMTMKKYVFNEFKPLIQKNPQSLIIMISLFMFIMFNNVPGLMPYIFTSTSHMALTLNMALPLWVGLMVQGWFFNTKNLLVHLIPSGTPTILMPFMVVIETISNIIRPMTLAIRLAANMIAGHLLISLLTSSTPLTPLYLQPLLFSSQLMLGLLETAVAFIQAYVFSVLITLYSAESIS